MCPTFHCNLTVRFTFNCLIQSNVEVTVKKTVNQLYNYSTVLRAAIKCKPYSEITVESGTHLKTVKITLNIFAVHQKMKSLHVELKLATESQFFKVWCY